MGDTRAQPDCEDVWREWQQQEQKPQSACCSVCYALQPIKNLKIKTNFGFTLGVDSTAVTPVYKLSSNTMNDVDNVYQSMSSGCSPDGENTADYTFSIAGKAQLRRSTGAEHRTGWPGREYQRQQHQFHLRWFQTCLSAQYARHQQTVPRSTALRGAKRVHRFVLPDVSTTIIRTVTWQQQCCVPMVPISSRGHRWGCFPICIGRLGHHRRTVHEECENVMDFFKLRASWGQNGNQSIPGFQYLSTISFTDADYIRNQ